MLLLDHKTVGYMLLVIVFSRALLHKVNTCSISPTGNGKFLPYNSAKCWVKLQSVYIKWMFSLTRLLFLQGFHYEKYKKVQTFMTLTSVLHRLKAVMLCSYSLFYHQLVIFLLSKVCKSLEFDLLAGRGAAFFTVWFHSRSQLVRIVSWVTVLRCHQSDPDVHMCHSLVSLWKKSIEEFKHPVLKRTCWVPCKNRFCIFVYLSFLLLILIIIIKYHHHQTITNTINTTNIIIIIITHTSLCQGSGTKLEPHYQLVF